MSPLRRIVVHEARVLSADRSLWVVALLLAVLVAYALSNGMAEARLREGVLRDIAQAESAREPVLLEQLRRVLSGAETPDPFANPVDPAAIASGAGARYAVMPYAPLSAIAFGQSDLLPNYYRVTSRSKASFMDETEMENPWNLLTGRFDLAFVVVALLPLGVLALGYNMLSAEREQGTLRMLLAQPLSARTLLLAKSVLRGGLVVGTVAAATAGMLAASGRLLADPGALAWLLALQAAYGAFWLALAAAVNALGRSSAFNALTLAGLWVALVLLVPVLVNLVVGWASPAPSRIELATRTRVATIEGLNRYQAMLSADYRYIEEPDALKPAPDGRFEVAPRRRAHFLIARDTDSRLETLRDAFDAQLDGQQALVDRLAFLSPAVLANEGIAAVAGTDAARYLHFRRAVGDFHARWKAYFEPRMLEGRAMNERDIASRPAFEWRERPAADVRAAAWLRLAGLVLPTLLLVAFAARRMRRPEVA